MNYKLRTMNPVRKTRFLLHSRNYEGRIFSNRVNKNRRGFTRHTRGGFTLTELMVTMVTSTIVISTIGIILADSHRGWNRMYNHIYADVVTDSYVARKAFDAVVRKASTGVSGNGWLEVYYYADASSPAPDRYVRFYYEADGRLLNVRHGLHPTGETLTTQTICENVSRCVFKVSGRTAQMILTLDDGSQEVTVVASGYMHN